MDIINEIKNKPANKAMKITIYIWAVYAIVVFSIFLNPHIGIGTQTSPINERMGFEVPEYTYEDISEFYITVKDNLNELSVLVPRDENGNVIPADDQFALKAVQNSGIPVTNGFIGKTYISPDSLEWWVVGGTAGETNLRTIQIGLSDCMTAIERSGVVAHEAAHVRGYVREDEANFISFVALRQSNHRVLQYNAWMKVYYLLWDHADPDRPFIDENDFTEELRRDLAYAAEMNQKASDEYAALTGMTPEDIHKKYHDSMNEYHESLIKGGQESGLFAYSDSVFLIMAYLEQHETMPVVAQTTAVTSQPTEIESTAILKTETVAVETETIAAVETAAQTELMPKFKYNLPEFAENIKWHSESIVKPILYNYYYYDDNITEHLPQAVIDGLEAEVAKSYNPDMEIGWFGVMEYDMDDDGDMDILTVGLEKNDEFFDSTKTTFIPYGGHESGIGINTNGTYKFISRAVTKYNARDYDIDDGFILSTKTNGLHDIYLNAGDGLFTSFDGEVAYQPLDLNYSSNFIMQSGLINESTARIVMMPMNAPVSSDEACCAVMRCSSWDNPEESVLLYTNTASGELAFYRNGQPITLENPSYYETPFLEFFVTADMYEIWDGRGFNYISEVYYFTQDEIEPIVR
jgi:hypothetical protein